MNMAAIRESTKRALKSAAEFAAVHVLPCRHRRGRLVLAYHGIRTPKTTVSGERTLHIEAELFEKQLEILEDVAEVVSLRELLAAESTSERLVAITFDDAYASAIRYGVPLCASKQFPCLVFVSPALLGNVPLWDRLAESGTWSSELRERMLWGSDMKATSMSSTEPRLRDLSIASMDELGRALTSYSNLTLGNHTFRHLNLGALTTTEVKAEISDAHQWLAEFAKDRYEPILAYPFGIPPAETPDIDDVWPVRFALKANGGWISNSLSTDPFLLPRWNVPADIGLNGFRARILGTIA